MNRKVDIEFRDEKTNPAYLKGNWGFHKFTVEDVIESPLFDDVNIFTFSFFGNDPQDELNSWADPLRALVFERLSIPNWRWYLSFMGWMFLPPWHDPNAVSINDDIKNVFQKKHSLNYIELSTGEYTYQPEERRMYVEVPNQSIQSVIMRYWSKNIPPNPIQGLQMPAGHFKRLQEWNEKPHTTELLREIIDSVRLLFYGYPSENYHLLFMSNKLNFDEMKETLDVEDLVERAKSIP